MTTRSPRSAATVRRPPLAGLRLLAPIEAPEIWCAGVTYERSRDARLEEAQTEARDVYALVYDADRPELFLKDAQMRRTVGPGGAIRVRSDSSWMVPEPERDARRHEVDVLLRELAEDRRVYHRGRDAIDEDAAAGDVLADRLRDPDHARLRGRVGARHRIALLACNRRDVDDPPVAGGLHRRDRGAVRVEDAVQVDSVHALPFLVADVLGVERLAAHAGAADEHVEPRQARDGRVELGRVADVVSVGEIEDVGLGPAGP